MVTWNLYLLSRCLVALGVRLDNTSYFSNRWSLNEKEKDKSAGKMNWSSAGSSRTEPAPDNPDHRWPNSDLPTSPSGKPRTATTGKPLLVNNLKTIGFKLFGKHYTIECYSWPVDISLSIAVQNLISFVEQVRIQQANQSQSNQMIQLPGGSQNGQNVIMMVPNR